MTMSMPAPLPQRIAALHGATSSNASVTRSVGCSAAMVTRRNTYALRIRGDRLQDSNLFDGDLLIIQRYQQGAHHETATATLNRREIALKALSINRLGVHLCPEDAAMPALFLHNCDIQVLGMVMGVEQHPPQRH